jgi:oligoendopeptidase F
MNNPEKQALDKQEYLQTDILRPSSETLFWNLSLIYQTRRHAYQEIIRMDLIIGHFRRDYVCSSSEMFSLGYEYKGKITELRKRLSFYFYLLSFTDRQYESVRNYVNHKAEVFEDIFKRKIFYSEPGWLHKDKSASDSDKQEAREKSRELKLFFTSKLKNAKSALKLNRLIKKYCKNKHKGRISSGSFYEKYYDMCNRHEFSFASESSDGETFVRKNNLCKFSAHPEQAVRKRVYLKKLASMKEIEPELFDNYSRFMRRYFEGKDFLDFLNENEISYHYYYEIIQLCKDNTHLQDSFNNFKKRELSLDKTGLWDDAFFRGNQLSLKEMKKLLRRPLKELGPQYIKQYDSIMRSNSLAVAPDYYQKENPSHYSNHLVEPSYIMLQSVQNVYDLLILAHEIGHGVHHRFSLHLQTERKDKLKEMIFSEMIAGVNMELVFQYYRSNPLRNAEWNRSLVKSYLLRKVNKLKLFPVHCEFQRIQIEELREKGYLPSPQQLSSLYYSLYKKFCGFEEDLNYMLGMDWLNQNLLYQPFYYFVYIPADIYAHHVVKKILGNKNYTRNYLEFLESPLKCSLHELLEMLDIADSIQELAEVYMSHLCGIMENMNPELENF